MLDPPHDQDPHQILTDSFPTYTVSSHQVLLNAIL